MQQIIELSRLYVEKVGLGIIDGVRSHDYRSKELEKQPEGDIMGCLALMQSCEFGQEKLRQDKKYKNGA